MRSTMEEMTSTWSSNQAAVSSSSSARTAWPSTSPLPVRLSQETSAIGSVTPASRRALRPSAMRAGAEVAGSEPAE